MNRLTHETTAGTTAATARRTGWSATLRFALAGAVALALILGLPYLSGIGKRGTPATALLAQSAESMADVRSVHLSARMRTLPGDNFELIGLNYDFVPIEMWKEFGDRPRWRVEKPGRVVVMDGQGTLMLIGSDTALRAGPRTGFVEWLMPLLDPQRLLETELASARQQKVAAAISTEPVNGFTELVLRTTPKAQGDFTNDWTRNKSIPESDHRRVYRFDPATKRLAGLQVFVGDVLVFETTAIRYNESFAPATFTVAVPPGVQVREAGAMEPTTRPLPHSARETAVRLFESLAAGDREGVASVCSYADQLMRARGGLTVISVGEPFRSGLYPGWFVPYEIKLANGEYRKHNLAVKNNNREKRWLVDGGI